MKCFVMMPFGGNDEYDKGERESQIVFQKIIEPALRQSLGQEVEIQLESAKSEAGSITASIIRNIAEADICIVDITGRNPNVFLELGIRFALKKRTTILMHQSSSDLPFDITAYRSFQYNALDQDIFKDGLVKLIKENMASTGKTDSLVFDVLNNHKEYQPVNSTVERIMPWSEYLKRLEKMATLLSAAIIDGRYRPNAIVGITNGGSMFADLLAMKAVHKELICNLWADRKSDDGTGMFDHAFNEGVIIGLKKQLGTEGKSLDNTRILLVDDMVASSITYNSAVSYLKEKLPNSHVTFLPFCFADREKLEKVRANLLWYHDAFTMDDEAVMQIHLTDYEKFPYLKPVRST